MSGSCRALVQLQLDIVVARLSQAHLKPPRISNQAPPKASSSRVRVARVINLGPWLACLEGFNTLGDVMLGYEIQTSPLATKSEKPWSLNTVNYLGSSFELGAYKLFTLWPVAFSAQGAITSSLAILTYFDILQPVICSSCELCLLEEKLHLSIWASEAILSFMYVPAFMLYACRVDNVSML